ncbi:MAG TPA: phasin family protein [Ramlibacter sp.]|jgi:hypothetical protein|uniref:phasin family protein n=1 Tax=Ramlibacter sp. TaxID=1917967 RepID=UPI002D5AAD58|nr:phasin family protein [Ramlibacter sp.]HZY19530.1 phasin family protein [Ramlibacter sp.]
MASKATRGPDGNGTNGNADDVTASATANAVNVASEMARQHMTVAADLMAVMFRANEALQMTQMQMSQRAALLHRQAADNMRRASSPMELMSIQSSLVVYECQEAMRYWQELMMAAARVGNESLQRSQLEPGATGAATQGPTNMAGAAMNAAAPMMQAWQQMFTGAMNGGATQQPH